MSRPYFFYFAGVCGLIAMLAGVPAMAKHPHRARRDSREALALAPAEVETLLAGMRTYLETSQGIVAALAENKAARVPEIATKSGVKLLQNTDPLSGFKLPLGFTMLSLDTHDKFDKLAEKARQGASRSELLTDLGNILGNCVSCHAAYKLGP
jgi:hypothetical protein